MKNRHRLAGPRLALSWLTVLPVRVERIDTAGCRQAITWAPIVGLLLGSTVGGVALGLHRLSAPALLTGLVVVALLALATRGMHVDGLADTADGFGCYGPPERALAVMRDGSTGPFGVVTLIVVLGVQAVSIGVLAESRRWTAIVLACTAGRAAFCWCCRRGFPAARAEGMGALVAGTQSWWVPATWTVLLLVTGWFVVPERHWQAPLAVAVAAAVTTALTWHARRRIGGLTGDVLGAVGELATTVVLAGCVLG